MRGLVPQCTMSDDFSHVQDTGVTNKTSLRNNYIYSIHLISYSISL